MAEGPFWEGMVERIRDFLKTTHLELEAGRDFYQEVFDCYDLFPLQRQTEMAWMMRKAREVSPQVVMEIGSDKGGSFYHWLQCQPTVRRACACEVRGVPWARHFLHTFRTVDLCFVEGSSYHPSSIQKVRRWLGQDSIDCLFLDGDKGNFLKDFDAYLPYMSPDGLVFLHDIKDSKGPKEAFEKLSRRYHTEQFIDTSDSERALERMRQGLPVATAHEGWLRHWAGASCGVGLVRLSKRK